MRLNGYALRDFRAIAAASPDPTFGISLDAIFGAPKTNNYQALSPKYQRSDTKPDKQFSHLPTVLQLAGDCEGMNVLDLGCGNGFYTVELAKLGANRVIGIDNSQAQLDVASEHKPPNVEYVLGDIFTDTLAIIDVIVAPYVINYAKTVEHLRSLFQKFYTSLTRGGRIVLVVDLPSCTDLKRFGAVKTALGPKRDETRIRIDLFGADEKHICALYATYYTEETLVSLLSETGFVDIAWHTPLINEEGLTTYGSEFWDGYTDDPQLGYLTAQKP
jgi:SAM-dependent methyltransferase